MAKPMEGVDPNGFLPTITGDDCKDFRLASPAMHFDETPTTRAGPAPELGQDTESVQMDASYDWDEITKPRERGGLAG